MSFDQIPDLWPKTTPKVAAVSPVAILRAQAAFITDRTKGVVQGDIKTHGATNKGFMHVFWLFAPCLNYHKHQLACVKHEMDPYPLKILDLSASTAWQTAENEAEFLEILTKLLKNGAVKKAIQTYMDQSLRSEYVETFNSHGKRQPDDIVTPYKIMDGQIKIGGEL